MSIQAAGNHFSKIKDIPHICFLFFSRLRFFLSTYSFGSHPRWLRALILGTSFFPLALFALSFGSLAVSFVKSRGDNDLPRRAFYLFTIFSSLVLGVLYVSRDLIADEGMRYFLPLVIPFTFSVAWWLRGVRSSFWKKAFFLLLVEILLVDSADSFRMQRRDTLEFQRMSRFLEEKQLRYGVADDNSSYALNALSHGQILATPLLSNARYKPIWNSVKEKVPRFYITGRLDFAFRKELDADPGLTKISFPNYIIFYGSSKLLERILQS